MDIQELVQLFTNNATAIVCLIYFMYDKSTTMKTFTDQMMTMNENIKVLIEHTRKED